MAGLPTVREYMDVEHHAVFAHDDIIDAVRKLIHGGITGAPVVDDLDNVIGLITEEECLRLLTSGDRENVPSGTVKDFMRTEFRTVTPEMDIYYVAGMFRATPSTRRFPVVDGDGKLLAVITQKDLLRGIEHAFDEGAPVPVAERTS